MAKENRKSGGSYFSDNPERRGGVTIWRLWVPVWLLILVPILVILGVAAKPSYRAYREHRIDQNLAAAQAAAQAGDWATARSQARSVMLARQGDLTAYRIWTQALCKQGDRGAFTAAIGLFADPRATREDRLEMLRALALQAPQALALRAFGSLPNELRDQASFRAAITPLLVRRGDLELAENQLREVAQPRDEPTVRLELLRVLVSQPEVGRVAEAREIFASLIADKADEAALAALLLLGDAPGGLVAGAPLPDLPAWLNDQPHATARHHLLGMQPALETAPESAEGQYKTAIKRFQATDPGALGTWLASNGKAELAATVLAEPARSSPDAFFAHLRILLSLRKDEEIGAALAAPPPGADPIEVELIRAAEATVRGRPDAAETALNKALDLAAADSSRNRFLELAVIADKSGAREVAENAWVAAVRMGWGPLPLYGDLRPVIAALTAKGRSEDLLAMTRSLLPYEPADLELQLDFQYLALLHDVLTPREVSAEVSTLIRRLDTPRGHATLMLASLLDGQPKEALAGLAKFRESNATAPVLITALEGTARLLVGETEAGTKLVGELDWSRLMPQESILLRGLLVKLKLSQLPVPEVAGPRPEIDPEQIPAWRKAVEQAEKSRAGGTLPALPTPRITGTEVDETVPKKP
jgi:hypothetical protein